MILSRNSVSQSTGCAGVISGTSDRAGCHRAARRPHPEGSSDLGQKSRRDAAVHEQRLGRVADTGTLDLGVEDDPLGHVKIGDGVDVDGTEALIMFHDRHVRLGGHPANEAFAAARDGQVDELGQAQEQADRVPVGRRDELDGMARQAARLELVRRAPGAALGWNGSTPCPRAGSRRCHS